jgi:hypothetical protein
VPAPWEDERDMNREAAVGFSLLAPIPPRLTGQPDSYLVPTYGKYPLFRLYLGLDVSLKMLAGETIVILLRARTLLTRPSRRNEMPLSC